MGGFHFTTWVIDSFTRARPLVITWHRWRIHTHPSKAIFSFFPPSSHTSSSSIPSLPICRYCLGTRWTKKTACQKDNVKSFVFWIRYWNKNAYNLPYISTGSHLLYLLKLSSEFTVTVFFRLVTDLLPVSTTIFRSDFPVQASTAKSEPRNPLLRRAFFGIAPLRWS